MSWDGSVSPTFEKPKPQPPLEDRLRRENAGLVIKANNVRIEKGRLVKLVAKLEKELGGARATQRDLTRRLDFSNHRLRLTQGKLRQRELNDIAFKKQGLSREQLIKRAAWLERALVAEQARVETKEKHKAELLQTQKDSLVSACRARLFAQHQDLSLLKDEHEHEKAELKHEHAQEKALLEKRIENLTIKLNHLSLELANQVWTTGQCFKLLDVSKAREVRGGRKRRRVDCGPLCSVLSGEFVSLAATAPIGRPPAPPHAKPPPPPPHAVCVLNPKPKTEVKKGEPGSFEK